MPIRGRDFSHIIVGAGSAGCVLAARLCQNPGNRVLLIEAGAQAWRDPRLKVPMMTAVLMRGSRHTWRFRTAPEPGLDNRRIDIPRGKVLGGSSAINGMVYVRGLAIDYDLWAQTGLSDWSFDAVRPYFHRSENYKGPGEATHHSQGGPLAVSRRPQPTSPLAEAYVEAGIAAGYPRAVDFNAPNAEGFGYYHFTIDNGHRVSAATAFLDDARHRDNLEILAGVEVHRLIVRNHRAGGIEYSSLGRRHEIENDGEIILCAGVFGSPAILLRSGIGPSADLEALDIPTLLDHPEVGRNLQDHLLIRVSHATREDASLHRLTRVDRAAWAFVRAWLWGTGPMNSFPLETGAYIRRQGDAYPTIQSHFLPALTSATLRFNPFAEPTNSGPGFMANASVMRPLSRGTLRLADKNPSVPPTIQFGYLRERQDLETLVDAVEILREVFAQKPFAPYRREELGPGPGISSRAQIADWVRQTASTMHHACGTCRMGADESSVVDSKLRVRGISNLRVVDASIFPSIPSTNTAAPTMMVAEKAADLLNA